MRVLASARSDVGKARATNEDFFAIEADHDLYLVADGMGGHGNGEVASRLATLSVCETIADGTKSGWRRKAGVDVTGDRLRKALEDANRAVFRAVEDDQALTGMGATMVAMICLDDEAVVAHVGDSRVYRFRNGGIEQLTEDHTWVGQQVAAGELSREEARNHPFRNVVTRALGGEAALEVELGRHSLRSGDVCLLCTDGLTTVLDDDEIKAIVVEGGPLEATCSSLIDAANERGGPDNVTVMLVSFSDDDEPVR